MGYHAAATLAEAGGSRGSGSDGIDGSGENVGVGGAHFTHQSVRRGRGSVPRWVNWSLDCQSWSVGGGSVMLVGQWYVGGGWVESWFVLGRWSRSVGRPVRRSAGRVPRGHGRSVSRSVGARSVGRYARSVGSRLALSVVNAIGGLREMGRNG